MSLPIVTTASLQVENLCKTYRCGDEELPVLRSINLQLRGGDAVAVMGPSGSGKSTLLHILGGLDCPSSGSVRVGQTDPFALSEPKLARFRNQTIGFVFQDHHLLPQCSVLENVLIPTLAAAGATAEAESHARELIERVGLTGRIEHRPAQLSGGERQRVAIARALINSPGLLLCDEPTGNLDRRAADRVAELLLELHGQAGAILVVVTHSTDLASRLAQCYELRDGELQATDGPNEKTTFL